MTSANSSTGLIFVIYLDCNGEIEIRNYIRAFNLNNSLLKISMTLPVYTIQNTTYSIHYTVPHKQFGAFPTHIVDRISADVRFPLFKFISMTPILICAVYT